MSDAIVKPLAVVVIKEGVSVLRKLTDKHAIAIHRGGVFLVGVMRVRDKPTLVLVLPIYIGNQSSFEPCILNGISAELIPMGENEGEFTPFDGSINMIASHYVDSLDAIQQEIRLAAERLRNIDSEDAHLKLIEHSIKHRKLLESIIVPADQISKTYLFLNCELGDTPPEALKGRFRIQIKGNVFFTGAMSPPDNNSVLFEGIIPMDVELVENVSVLHRFDDGFTFSSLTDSLITQN